MRPFWCLEMEPSGYWHIYGLASQAGWLTSSTWAFSSMHMTSTPVHLARLTSLTAFVSMPLMFSMWMELLPSNPPYGINYTLGYHGKMHIHVAAGPPVTPIVIKMPDSCEGSADHTIIAASRPNMSSRLPRPLPSLPGPLLHKFSGATSSSQASVSKSGANVS